MAVIKLNNDSLALVDDEDFERLSAYRWSYHQGGRSKTGYARTSIGTCVKTKVRIRAFMHELILASSPGLIIDHIDGNGLNNQKLNLRLITSIQSQGNIGIKSNNTSGYKGVTFSKSSRKWIAQINMGGGQIKRLGSFSNIKEAAIVYNEAAILRFGECAYLNKI